MFQLQALTDFYPKGAFSIGKMIVNLCTIWVLYGCAFK